jgi:hypothetical protein
MLVRINILVDVASRASQGNDKYLYLPVLGTRVRLVRNLESAAHCIWGALGFALTQPYTYAYLVPMLPNLRGRKWFAGPTLVRQP